jgi:hypothetical protein
MARHINSKFHPGFSHSRAARAKKSWREGGMQRLIIEGGNRHALRKSFSQGTDEFSRQQVPAGFPCDQHEIPGPHAAKVLLKTIRSRFPNNPYLAALI